jgi:hypothetical protein
MKYLSKPFVVALSAIALSLPAYAQQTDVSHEAAALLTQPATIRSGSGQASNQSDRLKQIGNSIPAVHNQPSQGFSPFDFLKNPSASLKQFFEEDQNTKPQQPQQIDPLGVSKKPPLDSETVGQFSVPVTHF